MTGVIIATVIVAIFLILVAIRTFQKERILLYILIPVILAFSTYAGNAVQSMLGYPTLDLSDLEGEFQYLAHSGQDPVFLTAIPDGAPKPRLYEIPKDLLSDEEKRGFTQAGEKTRQSVAQMGRFAEGQFEFYDFAVDQLPPKEN